MPILHLVRKLIPAVLLVALAGCGGSKPLPPGAEEGDPPRVIAEYARIAKMSDCEKVKREYDVRWDRWRNDRPGKDDEDLGWAIALARRSRKLDCPASR